MTLKIRNQFPKFFVDYRSYKPYLRIEFDHRCAYCDIHEAEDGGCNKFHIDHYRPQKKFPQQVNIYSNLFYSCSNCNRWKGNFWPNCLDLLFKKYILNPCDHDFNQHYDKSKPKWGGKSSTALWNIERLRLNSPIKLQIREDRILSFKWIDELEKQKLEFINLKNTINCNSEILEN